MNQNVYLDYSASYPIIDKVLDLNQKDAYKGNPNSMHKHGVEAGESLLDATRTIADILNCDADEIFLSHGGGLANFGALQAMEKWFSDNEVDCRVLSSGLDHPSIKAAAEQLSVSITGLPDHALNKNGSISNQKAGEYAHTHGINSAIITQRHPETGAETSLDFAYDIYNAKRSWIHLDACQSFCKLQIDLSETPWITSLSLSAHKFGGPQGIGAYFVRKDRHVERKIIDSTHNPYLAAQMARAAKTAFGGGISIQSKFSRWVSEFLSAAMPLEIVLSRISEVPIFYAFVKERKGMPIAAWLDSHGFSVSEGTACSKGTNNRLRELNGLDETWHGLRISWGYMTTVKEIEDCTNEIKRYLN